MTSTKSQASANGAATLSIEGVEAGYGGQRVLRDVSLEVPPGGLVTLIGPNGHGKTTLLRAISGLIPVWRGQIRLDDKDISGRKAHDIVAAGIAHIPQGDLLFPDMSVRDNLLMGAYLPAANAQADARLVEVYDLLPRLREREKQIANTLSGGERRMLAIGRGLMGVGRLMLIDEPSLGLAPLVIDQIYEVIADLKRRGISILLVEENASRVTDLADRAYLLDDGAIVWQGAAGEMSADDDVLQTYLGG